MSQVIRICFVLGWLCCAVFESFAQADGDNYFDRDKNISVKDRPKPEYQTDGIRSGAFVYKPKLNIATEYTNNVFAEEQEKDSDVVAIIAPGIRIHTDLNIHKLEFDAELESRQYFDNPSESHTNFVTAVRGQLDVKRDAYFTASASFRRNHDDRSTAGAGRIAEERISVDEFDSFIRGYREFGRTRVQADIKYRNRNYADGTLQDGTVLSQEFRNRKDLEIAVRGDYAISADTALFGRLIYIDENYNDDVIVESLDQQVFIFEVGTDFEVTELIRGQIAVGVSDVSFDVPVREGFNSLSYQGSLEWFATPLITVEVNASRRVNPSTLITASSILEDQIAIKADYEWRRNIVYSVGGAYRKSNFRDLDRDDKRLSYFVSGTYQMNRNVGFTASFINTDLDSAGAFQQADFNETALMVGLVLRK